MLEDMITWYDSPSLRKAYLRVEGRGFLSGTGGYSSGGTSLAIVGVRGLDVAH